MKDNSGPAFPVDEIVFTHTGMTLRDYFAAKAMRVAHAPSHKVGASENLRELKAFADRCYDIADAMIAARNR